VKLPDAAPPGWGYWSASGTDSAVVWGWRLGFRRLEDGEWTNRVPPAPFNVGAAKFVLTGDGDIACLAGRAILLWR
jgi:hypothetical protein